MLTLAVYPLINRFLKKLFESSVGEIKRKFLSKQGVREVLAELLVFGIDLDKSMP